MRTRIALLSMAAVLVAGAGLAVFFIASRNSNTEAESTRDIINRKLAGGGDPTINPDVDIDATREAWLTTASAETEVLPGTPSPLMYPSCGPLEGRGGGYELVEAYGEIRTDCNQLGALKLVATAGKDGGPGAIALLECSKDLDCTTAADGSPSSGWVVYPAPNNGPVKVLAMLSETEIVVNNGGMQCRFSLAEFNYSCP